MVLSHHCPVKSLSDYGADRRNMARVSFLYREGIRAGIVAMSGEAAVVLRCETVSLLQSASSVTSELARNLLVSVTMHGSNV